MILLEKVLQSQELYVITKKKTFYNLLENLDPQNILNKYHLRYFLGKSERNNTYKIHIFTFIKNVNTHQESTNCLTRVK